MSKSNIVKKFPFVSVCTPTFNRRPFIPAIIECFNNQDYPKNRIEWIIIDDGTDKIEDLVCNINCVKYFKYDNKMTLGKKRNLMHEKCKGSIIVYMDDDDFYPSQRISHAVSTLINNKNALCAGSSIMNIWFKHINQMWEFGPYGPNHSTAGTFAFKKELLNITKYNDNASLAEEKEFLKNYTIPFVQLDPRKTILVFSHSHNTFDKKKLLENINPKYAKPCNLKITDFIKNTNLCNFYTNEIENLLNNYEPGKPEMKPDVLKQIIEIEKHRKNIIENNKEPKITIKYSDGKEQILKTDEILNLLQLQTNEIKFLKQQIEMNVRFIDALKNKIIEKDNIINNFKNNIINKNVNEETDINKNVNEDEQIKKNNIELIIKEKDNTSQLLNEINQIN